MALQVSQHLKSDDEVILHPEKFYDRVIEINLSELEPYINGPFSPDIATPLSKMKEMAGQNGWPESVDVGLIGSCTNSSYEDMSRAASVVKNAMDIKLDKKAEFKITPGSEQIRHIACRDGYLKLFEEAGGEVFANACGPCIGQWDRKGSDNNQVNTIIHSFNRNFAKRADGNPNTHAFVASPEIVTAIAIAGKLTFNPITDTLINRDGQEVMLAEPSGYELPPNGFEHIDNGLLTPDTYVPHAEIHVNPESDRLQCLVPFPEWDGLDFIALPLLIKVKGKCTTDHISMAGPWLKYRGHLENISNNYMIGAINSFNGEANKTLNQLTGNYEPVPAIAKSYKQAGVGSVVVGEENFGEGSSREHAAMEPRFLNVKTIIVKSFARIHETNLKKQGILPLTFTDKADYDRIRETDRLTVSGLNNLLPGQNLNVTITHSDGSEELIEVKHTFNKSQIEWFKAGSALNLIRKSGA
jgi:aconitate hydratase